MTEWAGLEFVNRLALDPPVVPRFFGGDIELGLIVIEDLGDVGAHGLSAILRGGDPEPAADALVAACATLGRLHAAAHGREREYRELRSRLPEASHEAFHQIYRTEGAVGRFITNVRQAGIAPSPGVQGELDSISARLADPGPFLTFTHGDVCLSNIARLNDGVRMFDLEVSGFRHALLDGAFVTMRSLGCQESGIIPAPVQRRMRDAYRRELAAAVPEARDDGLYNTELVALSAVWLALLLDRLPAALEKDRKMVLGANRQRILHALDIFTRLAGEHACFPAIARTARDLHARLRDLWPGDEHQLALFPAFI